MMIEFFMYAYISGVLGSVIMDITEALIAKKGISSGVTLEDIGRWFLAMLYGRFRHTNIQTFPHYQSELLAGKLFHYLLAGGGIALFYPLGLYLLGVGFEVSHLLYGAIFGFLTNVFTWFWRMPSFGWGLCGIHSPDKYKTILAPTISHIIYGVGVGLCFEFLLKV